MKLILPYISRFLSRRISSFSRHCLVSRLSVQTDFGNLLSPQIPGACDIQTQCCCSHLNLGTQRTYITGQIFHPKKYHVPEFRHYYVYLYYNSNYPERQTLSNSKTPHKPYSSPARSAEWPRRNCFKKKEICDGVAFRLSGFHSLLFASYL